MTKPKAAKQKPERKKTDNGKKERSEKKSHSENVPGQLTGVHSDAHEGKVIFCQPGDEQESE